MAGQFGGSWRQSSRGSCFSSDQQRKRWWWGGGWWHCKPQQCTGTEHTVQTLTKSCHTCYCASKHHTQITIKTVEQWYMTYELMHDPKAARCMKQKTQILFVYHITGDNKYSWAQDIFQGLTAPSIDCRYIFGSVVPENIPKVHKKNRHLHSLGHKLRHTVISWLRRGDLREQDEWGFQLQLVLVLLAWICCFCCWTLWTVDIKIGTPYVKKPTKIYLCFWNRWPL